MLRSNISLNMLCRYTNDAADADDVASLMYGANIASLGNEMEQHHICEANASYRVSDISWKSAHLSTGQMWVF